MPATSDNPTGPIPYRITSQERSDLLDRIENLFGDELSAYEDDIANSAESYNAVIFAVHSIRSNLLHDTYEEASE